MGPGWNLWEGSTSLNPFIYRHFRPFRWNVEPFHDFCRQQSISLVARLLITRASRAYFSRPTRLLLKADENTPHDLREYFSYFTIKGKRNYGKFWRINIIREIRFLKYYDLFSASRVWRCESGNSFLKINPLNLRSFAACERYDAFGSLLTFLAVVGTSLCGRRCDTLPP